ncbi:hypothetical protein FAIPA1_300021 [Frankia sp. AiPs1]
MVDSAPGLRLADVRGLSLDRLRDSMDSALRAGVEHVLSDLGPCCVRASRDTGDGGGGRRRLH